MSEGTTEEEKKDVKARTVSLFVKVFDVVFVVAFFVLKGLEVLDVTVNEICMTAGVIAAIFGDVSLNLALEKFRKNEGK